MSIEDFLNLATEESDLDTPNMTGEETELMFTDSPSGYTVLSSFVAYNELKPAASNKYYNYYKSESRLIIIPAS